MGQGICGKRGARRPQRRRGFTLVELLVVIAIIGILVALLLPAVQAAREAARSAHCKNNLKQIGLALQLYHDVNRCFPWAEPASPNISGWAWSTVILPYMEQKSIYDDIDWNHVSNTPENADVIKHFIDTYQCPSAPEAELVSCCYLLPGVEDSAETNYVAVGTSRPQWQALAPRGAMGAGVMHRASNIRLADVTDGTSNTFLCAEADVDQDDPWRHSQSGPSDPYCPNLSCVIGHEWRGNSTVSTAYGVNADTELMYPGPNSLHPGGAHFNFVDGHVSFLPETIDQALLEGLTTYRGGEVVNLE